MGVSTTSIGSFSQTRYVFQLSNSNSGEPVGRLISKFQIIRARIKRSSIQARFWPIQLRVPSPKGLKIFRLSLLNSDGDDELLASQRSGRNLVGRAKLEEDMKAAHRLNFTTV